MIRAQNPTPERKTFSFSVRVDAELCHRLESMKGRRSENIRAMLENYGAMMREVRELRKFKNLAEREQESWRAAWTLDQHALGQHFDAPVRGCAACEEN